jgi:hypothetical protein
MILATTKVDNFDQFLKIFDQGRRKAQAARLERLHGLPRPE